MANMWPRQLPNWVLNDPRRGAEIRVFRKLENIFDSDWYIFYSRPWWGISPKGGEIDGEADFILVHKDFGILFIEVKGGGVNYDPEKDQWHSVDSFGILHKIKDPVKQAMTCKHKFLERLKKFPEWPKSFIKFRHGVIFPDSSSPQTSAQTIGQYEKFIFCFSDEFDHDLKNWIEKRLADHPQLYEGRKELGPGQEGLNIILSLVANPISLRVPLKREIEGDLNATDILLTGAQLSIINFIDSVPRALIEGGAGTGKTLLATEMAARYSEQGKQVLFTCRSGPLAEFLKERLKNFEKIEVLNFEDLSIEIKKLNKVESISYFNLWDVVIVDEGQDFDWEWWDLINEITSAKNSLLRVFTDSNQAVYRLRDDLVTRLNVQSFPLRINLRNTKSIAEVTNYLYKGPLIEAPGPNGEWPELNLTKNINEAIQLALMTVKNLIQQESTPPNMISVLTPNAEIREQVIANLYKINIPATNAMKIGKTSVTVEIAARFKGLESPIILLISDRELSKNQEISYVAVSRARSRLFIIGPIQGSPLEMATKNKLISTSSIYIED